MKILFVVSEVFPLVKTGGMADVAAALPAALAELGEDVRILVPAYPGVADVVRAHGDWLSLGDPLGAGEARVALGRMPDTGVQVWMLSCPTLYDRKGGIYSQAEGRDWADNHVRFALLARAAAMLCDGGAMIGWRPDILHAHDWQTGLAPAYLALRAGKRPGSVFTIHNLAFPGVFPAHTLVEVGLPPESYSLAGVEFHGSVSFLKAGIQYADRITTVSPTYAGEILGHAEGGGFAGLLAHRKQVLSGILNGIDARTWDPEIDPYLARAYSPETLDAKAENKAALQRELGLPETEAPVFAVISRLTRQKGLDLALEAADEILDGGGQLAVLGAGDTDLEQGFVNLARRAAGVAARIGYDEALAHMVVAGADILLMPSRFEPCGLTQMQALRYGTLPLVRRTGGLADTVDDATAAGGRGTGFVFEPATAAGLASAVRRALAAYARPGVWRKLQRRAMKRDSGWNASAKRYRAIYRELA